MTALHFDLAAPVAAFIQKEGMMVVFAAFGVPVILLALALVSFFFRKAGLEKVMKPVMHILICTFALAWIPGFLVQILFMFVGVSPERLFLIEAALLLTCFVFSVFHTQQLKKIVLEYDDGKVAAIWKRKQIRGN